MFKKLTNRQMNLLIVAGFVSMAAITVFTSVMWYTAEKEAYRCINAAGSVIEHIEKYDAEDSADYDLRFRRDPDGSPAIGSNIVRAHWGYEEFQSCIVWEQWKKYEWVDR